MIWNPLSVWKVFCLYKKNLKQEAPKLQKQKQVINATTDVIIMTSPFFTRIWKFPFLRLSFCKDNPSHQANFAWFIKIRLRKWIFFRAKEFFYMIFDFTNGGKNEIKDHNQKSCSWFRNRVSRKIDFKALWLRNGHADSVGVKL